MRLLDLFCGAGGASVGYRQAGFRVVGVDILPQPSYPFAFVQMDALRVKERMWTGSFDAVHASPPCQAHTTLRHRQNKTYPDLVGSTRDLLKSIGLPYVIENVPLAPLIDPVMLCGSAFELGVRRHRTFEASFPLVGTTCEHARQGTPVGVYGEGGGGKMKRGFKSPGLAESGEVMGIWWMKSLIEIAQAIPPAYTKYVGTQLASFLGERDG